MTSFENNDRPECDFWADSYCEEDDQEPPIDWLDSPDDDGMPVPQFQNVRRTWPVLKSTTSSSSCAAKVPSCKVPLTPSSATESPCDHILGLIGKAVLLPIPSGEKGPRISGWQKTTLDEMTPRHLSQLNANIGVLLGKSSNGLCTIDCDEDELFDQFLKANPPLNDTLHSRGARGGNVWVRILGSFPVSGKIRDQSRKALGEWRADGNQTVIHGIHPSGKKYTRNEKSVLSIAYSDIKWPEGWGVPGSNMKATNTVERIQPRNCIDSSSLVSPEKVESTLFKIPPRPDYDTWFRVSAAVRNSLGNNEQAIEMLKSWSTEEQEGEYSRLLYSSSFSEIGFGTLAHYAKEHAEENSNDGTEVDDNEPLFTDLSGYLDGTAHQELPSVGATWGDKFLFYAGRLNEIHAEPGVGKTNVLMAACIAVLNTGRKVLYIDPEDTPQGFATRMLMLGADAEDIREKVFYLHNPEPKHILAAQEWARNNHPELVILDGLAESMAAVSADENSAGDVLRFFRDNLRPFADAGAAVVIADHVTKNSENRGQFARGSGAKAGRYDGVSYEIQSARQYTPSQAGFVKLKIAKDRNGGAGPRNRVIAELHFTPGTDGRTFTTFQQSEQAEGPFRPTAIMGKIVRHLQTHPTAKKSMLRQLGKSQAVDLAIDFLKEDGVIGLRIEGQTHNYFLNPPACSSVPTLFRSCSEQMDQPCSPVPPP